MQLLPGRIYFLLALIAWLTGIGKVAAQSHTHTLSVNKTMTQYQLDKWTSEHGLPSNSLNSLLQTYDGYLWITSTDGLIRFDGVQFKTFNKRDMPELFTNSFTALCQTTDSTLWIGTEGNGLISYKKGVFKVFGINEGFHKRIESLYADRQGKIWIGTRGKGVYVFDYQTIKPFGHGSPLEGSTVKAIAQDAKGGLWFGTDSRMAVRYENEKFETYGIDQGLVSDQVLDLMASPRGKMWAGTSSGLYLIDENTFRRIAGTETYRINHLWEDASGVVWLATDNGLVRLYKGQQSILSEENGLSNKILRHLLMDREGSLWMATHRGGLCRIKDGKFTNFTTREGLLSNLVNSVAEHGEQTYVVGMDVSTLNRIIDAEVMVYSPLPEESGNGTVKHLFVDKSRNLWVSTDAGLYKIDPNGKSEVFNKANAALLDDAVQLTYQDRKGNIWFGTRSGGLAKMLPETRMFEISSRETGFASNYITSIGEDAEGNLLVGTDDAGLQVISAEDEQVTTYSTRDGLLGNPVYNTYTDKQGVVWIATSAGLTRFHQRKFIHYSAKSGLPADAFYDIIEDDNGFLWLTSSKGILRVLRQDLDHFAEDKIKHVKFQRYDHYDGMPQDQCMPYSFSIKDSKGKLWFSTMGGVAMIDPAHVQVNMLKPSVLINDFLVNGTAVDHHQGFVTLEPGQTKFVFHYTALSMLAPQKVRFKYRLDPVDKDWVEADHERDVAYTNLAPGTYTFRVIASNNDGIWNETGAIVSFRLKPYFYQTTWFYVLVGLLLLSAVVLTYRWRVRRIRRRNRELQVLVDKRTVEIQKQKEEIEDQRDRIEEQREKLADAYHDIKIVSEIGQRVTSVLHQEDMIGMVYENVNSLIPADIFGLGLYNERMHTIEYVNYIRKGNRETLSATPVGEKNNLAVMCLERREAICINDFEKEYSHYFKEAPPQDDNQPKSVIYMPLVIGNTPLGVITVQNFESNVYRDRHYSILQTLAAYISIALDNSRAYEIIRGKNHQITDSLRYAFSIQQAVLPSAEKMNHAFREYFVISRPRDIVSGDFYWFNPVGDSIYLAVVDCTGHGVPGAFMSMIGSALLNEIVNIQKIYSTNEILTNLHDDVRTSLKQEESKNTDGMDVCLCLLEPVGENQTKVTFSGASRPLYYTHQGQLKEIKGDHRAIGGMQKKANIPFTSHEIVLGQGDCLYLCTDGFTDQNAPGQERFGSVRLKEMLLRVTALPMKEQHVQISKTLDDYQQSAPQRDDITMIGIKL